MAQQQEDPAIEQIRAIFREEGRDLVQRLEEGLLKLEAAEPAEREQLVRSMQRNAHNLKGAAGSLGFKATSELAHALEDVLGRHEALAGHKEAFDILHHSIDALGQTLNDRRMPKEGAEALAALRGLMGEVASPLPAYPAGARLPGMPPAEVPPGEADWVRIPLPRLSELMLQAGEAALRLQGVREHVADLRAQVRELGTALAGWPAAHATTLQRALATALDRLEFDALRDSLLVESVHASIRSLRMRPLSTVFRLLPRMARDLGRSLGKEAVLTVSGGAIEVERNVLDLLRDALVHLVRNAMDHGLETTSERAAAGKPPAGRIHVAARLLGHTLWMELSDDGRGVDPRQVRQAALAAKVLSPQEADALPESALQELIFQPGLTTKATADEISGRGMGLDAVRAQVEQARGSLRLASTVGAGTTFILQLPVLTHRTHVLVVRAGPEHLALPTSAVWKVLRLPRQDRTMIGGQQVLELEGALMPVVPLAPMVFSSEAGRLPADASVVVLKASDRVMACAVDELLLDEEVVVRDVEPPLQLPSLLSGVAVRTTGEALCVLNPAEMVKQAGVRAVSAAPAPIPQATREARRVLIVDDSFTIRTLEKSILELAGYEVLVATDGEEALATLARERVDVVVSDINMPRRDGFELLSAVRRTGRLRTLPFILITSRSSEADRRRGLDLGASAYVVKSEFDQETLIDVVSRFAG